MALISCEHRFKWYTSWQKIIFVNYIFSGLLSPIWRLGIVRIVDYVFCFKILVFFFFSKFVWFLWQVQNMLKINQYTTNFLWALLIALSSCSASSETFWDVLLYSAVANNLVVGTFGTGGTGETLGNFQYPDVLHPRGFTEKKKTLGHFFPTVVAGLTIYIIRHTSI